MTLHAMSLPNIMTGIARSLRDDVLEHLEDDYARMQVRAIVELVENLSPRITWDTELLRADAERTECAVGWEADSSDDPAERLRQARAALGEMIDELYTGEDDPERRAAAWAVVQGDFDNEAGLIKTGSLRT